MSDKEFFNDIFEKYHNRIYLEIQKKLYSKIPEDINSCLDDTFCAAWENIKKLRKHENIAGWLIIAAQNTAHNFNRKYNIRQRHEINSNIIDYIPDKEDFTEKVLGEFTAEKILAGLRPEERKLYDYKYVMGYSHEKIGKMLRITPNAVALRNKKLIKKLQKIYETQK